MKLLLHLLFLLLISVPLFAADPPIKPDPKLTPGAVLEVTREDLCTPGYTKKVRDVPASVKNQVYALYGITSHEAGEYEVDHLISLELGGSNSIKNLWPQSYRTQPWNAHVKDRVENKLHSMVCKGEIDLKSAQDAIATDWIAAYKKYVGPEPTAKAITSPTTVHSPPTSSPGSPAKPPSPESSRGIIPWNTPNAVWVNTKSGVYWRPGSTYYGATKEGKIMSEAQALQQGYHAAKSK